MSDLLQPAPLSNWREPSLLLALRLSVDFVLDVAQLSRGEGDLLDPLLMTAMLEANQAVVRHDPQLALLYGEAWSALPDELRRPISINALAKSLQMPFESVRRRVRAWVAAGRCVQTPDGVYVPQSVATSAAYLAVQAARVRRLEVFQQGLERAHLLTAPGPASPEASSRDLAPRAADRVLGEYMLRSCERLMTLCGGAMEGFVFLGLCAANARSLPTVDHVSLEEMIYAAQPCSAVAIADRIGLPRESVRRHLLALGAHGLAQRTQGGWSAAAPPDLADPLGRMAAENARDLRRMFLRLQVLRCADAEAAAGGAAR